MRDRRSEQFSLLCVVGVIYDIHGRFSCADRHKARCLQQLCKRGRVYRHAHLCLTGRGRFAGSMDVRGESMTLFFRRDPSLAKVESKSRMPEMETETIRVSRRPQP